MSRIFRNATFVLPLFFKFRAFHILFSNQSGKCENAEFKEDTLNLTTPASIAYPAAAGVTLCSQTFLLCLYRLYVKKLTKLEKSSQKPQKPAVKKV